MKDKENNNQNLDPKFNKEQAMDLFEIRSKETEIKKFDVSVQAANHDIKEARQALKSVSQSIEATRHHTFDDRFIEESHIHLVELFKQTTSKDEKEVLDAVRKYNEIAGPFLNRIAYLKAVRDKKIKAQTALYEAQLTRDNVLGERTRLEIELEDLEKAYFEKYQQTANGGLVWIDSSLIRKMMKYSLN